MTQKQTDDRVINGLFRPTDIKAFPASYVGDQKQWALIVAYIDAPILMDKLDERYGATNWSYTYDVISTEPKFCQGKTTITITTPEGKQLVRTGVGTGNDHKEAESDSFKRACRSIPEFNRFLWKQKQVIIPAEKAKSLFKYGYVNLEQLDGTVDFAKMEIHFNKLAKLIAPTSSDSELDSAPLLKRLEGVQTKEAFSLIVQEVKTLWDDISKEDRTKINAVIRLTKERLGGGNGKLPKPQLPNNKGKEDIIWTSKLGDKENKKLLIQLMQLTGDGKFISKTRVLNFVNQVYADKLGMTITSRKEIPVGAFDELIKWVHSELEKLNTDLAKSDEAKLIEESIKE